MRLFSIISALILLLSCKTNITNDCDEKLAYSSKALSVSLSNDFYCAEYLKIDNNGHIRFSPKILIRLYCADCQFEDIVDRYKLTKYEDSLVQNNAITLENPDSTFTVYPDCYSGQTLWEIYSSQYSDFPDYMRAKEWWTPDIALTNNYANYILVDDTGIIRSSKLDSIWNGKLVIQPSKSSLFVYIEMDHFLK